MTAVAETRTSQIVTPTSKYAGKALRLHYWFALCLVALTSSQALAQGDSPIPVIPSDGTVSDEQLDSAIAAIESRESLDQETRNAIVEQLRDAQSQLQNRKASIAAAEAFTASLSSAPDETAALQEVLQEPPPDAPTLQSLGISDDTALADLEQLLARKRAESSGAETALADLESSIQTEENRPAQARQRIEELRASRSQLEAQISGEPPPGENSILTDARKLAAEVRLDARSAELNRLEQELASHNVRLELLKAERDLKAREVATIRRELDAIQRVVNMARQDDASRLLREVALAELEAADKHPVVRDLARRNAELGAELPLVVADIERVTADLAEAENQARSIEKMFEVSQQRLDVGGVSQAIGRLFAEERRNLPQVSQYRDAVRERRKTLSSIGLAQVRIDEERRTLTPISDTATELMREVANDVSDEDELATIRDEVQQLLSSRRQLLNQAAGTYTTYLRALSDLDVAQRRLLAVSSEYKNFLDQHLLWIPSSPLVGPQTFTKLAPAIGWTLSPENWLETLSTLITSARNSPFRTSLALLLLAAVVLVRRELIKRNRLINSKVGPISSDSIWLTIAALAIAAVVALPIPLAIAILGVELSSASASSPFALALGAGLLAIGPFMYNVRLFRLLCGENGVLRVHFGWEKEVLAVIRRQLDFLLAVGVPTALAAVVAYQSPVPAYRDSLGRIAFVALMIVFALVFFRLGHPNSGVSRRFYDSQPDRLITRLRWLWYWTEIGAPLLLAFIALLGFQYTAAILTGRLIDTVWLIVAIVVLNLVLLRWLSLTRRKLALQRALEKRAQRKAEQEEAEESSPADDSEGPPVVESKPMDLDVVDLQTRRLLQSGLFVLGVLGAWGIWSEVLPALGILEEVSLWSETVKIDGVDTQVPVSLADLLLALVTIAVTWIASRNLPGLMEIAILQHIDLQPGGRYTINTLLRYIVVTVGVVIVLNVVGWSWSRIQWLVAALSVGLGFGLQEIVANFISGLIILFERPVRVGDTVTVGQLTGTVSKVRIRATTITDWDRKEIIVPNKAFITDQVINWTLSDPITRIVIDTGISYGSDVKLAHRVMEETLRNQPMILDEPEPKVYFMGFGDSSLNFRLYVYARQLADRLPIMHAVHEDIFHALKEHGIEIPFPQRDLHVRSVSPGVKWDVAARESVNDDKPEE